MQVGAGAGTGDAGVHYVLLIDPNDFSTVAQTQVSASNGQYGYQLTGVAPGTYLVAAGTDMDNDFLICDAGEACGAYPTLSPMTSVTVGSSDLTGIDFATGFNASIGAGAASASTSPSPVFTRRTQRQVRR
jgi:serine protease